jgi:glycosyltransferase involved in cell wall biosynthesis
MAKGVPEEKIVVVYNWVDEEAVKHVPREENVLFDRYGLDRSKFYITYCGNIGLTQNLQMLTEVAKEMEVNEDIQFVLVGNGAYKEELERIIQDKQIKNITLLPFQPYEEISHVFSLGDVSLVISKPGVGENSVPSKTWSILSASRPVLANFDENELKTIVDENQCGIFTKAGDKDAFKQAIMDLYNDRERCKQLGENGREFILKNLTRAVGTQKYVDVIKSFDKSNDNTTFILAPDPRGFDGGDMLRKHR